MEELENLLIAKQQQLQHYAKITETLILALRSIQESANKALEELSKPQ
jgi:hypothetical protein